MPSSDSFDPYLEPVLVAREPRLSLYLPRLSDFHQWALTEVDAQANYTDRYAQPVVETYDRNGEIANRIVVNPWYQAQHQDAYRRGIIALPYLESAPHLVSFAMNYLLSQADVSLACPVTLTGAVAYVLAYHASPEVRSRYLPDLLRMDGSSKSGATWATEKHGGSDVGATTTRAVPQGQNFALHGLKWFASNANAGLAIATARPEGAESGSRGLGLYLVPSHLADGAPNHLRIRRLKDKLGTKGLPTGEIDLLGAEAVEIAPPPNGFRLMMEALEYSRVHNAVGAAGVQRRALQEALRWAKSREAFGHLLLDYPMVQNELLRLRVEFEAGSLLAFEAALAFDESLSDPSRKIWLRLMTALAKYLSAEYAIHAARAALELIGGNGYTSDYPIARIYRDAQVLTVWEGPANIQALELLRLLSPRYGGATQYETNLRQISECLSASLPELARALEMRLTEDLDAIKTVIASRQNAEGYARKLLHRMSQTMAFALMCRQAGVEAATGTERASITAICYQELLQPPKIGAENRRVRQAAISLLTDEVGMRAQESHTSA